MINEGSTQGCQFYGIDSGLMYGKGAVVVGVEDNSEKKVWCAECEFRFSCGIKN